MNKIYYCFTFTILFLLFSCDNKTSDKNNALHSNVSSNVTKTVSKEENEKEVIIGDTIVSNKHIVKDNNSMKKSNVVSHIDNYNYLYSLKNGILNGTLTNVTDKDIELIYSTLEDKREILHSLKKYIGSQDKYMRNIAIRFYEYMNKNFKEEKYQGCSYYMIGMITKKEINTEDSILKWNRTHNGEKLVKIIEDAIKYHKKVLELPSKEHFYAAALSDLGQAYSDKARYDHNNCVKWQKEAKRYYWMWYYAANKPSQKDAALCSILGESTSPEEAQEFYDKYKDRKWSDEDYKNWFEMASP